MLGLKVKTKDAERAKEYLLRHNLFNRRYRVFGRGSFIYLPLAATSKSQLMELKKLGRVGIMAFPSTIRRPGSYRELLKSTLGKGGYASVVKGYDLLGNIAVIDAPKSMAKKVAKAVMSSNRSVETVLRKEGAVKGKYRTRGYSHVLGLKSYVAVYKENGCIFRFDVRKVFFSARLAYERLRIAKLVKSHETVLVMFAGVGPFAIEIAKAHGDANVVAVELNGAAYRSMLENIRMNGIDNVTAECGDAKKLGKRYRSFADRIVMPLPKDSYAFLDAVNRYAKNGCMVHYYAFGETDSAFEYHTGKIRKFFSKRRKKIVVFGKRIVRPYSAHEIEIVLDFAIRKR